MIEFKEFMELIKNTKGYKCSNCGWITSIKYTDWDFSEKFYYLENLPIHEFNCMYCGKTNKKIMGIEDIK